MSSDFCTIFIVYINFSIQTYQACYRKGCQKKEKCQTKSGRDPKKQLRSEQRNIFSFTYFGKIVLFRLNQNMRLGNFPNFFMFIDNIFSGHTMSINQYYYLEIIAVRD